MSGFSLFSHVSSSIQSMSGFSYPLQPRIKFYLVNVRFLLPSLATYQVLFSQCQVSLTLFSHVSSSIQSMSGFSYPLQPRIKFYLVNVRFLLPSLATYQVLFSQCQVSLTLFSHVSSSIQSMSGFSYPLQPRIKFYLVNVRFLLPSLATYQVLFRQCQVSLNLFSHVSSSIQSMSGFSYPLQPRIKFYLVNVRFLLPSLATYQVLFSQCQVSLTLFSHVSSSIQSMSGFSYPLQPRIKFYLDNVRFLLTSLATYQVLFSQCQVSLTLFSHVSSSIQSMSGFSYPLQSFLVRISVIQV